MILKISSLLLIPLSIYLSIIRESFINPYPSSSYILIDLNLRRFLHDFIYSFLNLIIISFTKIISSCIELILFEAKVSQSKSFAKRIYSPLIALLIGVKNGLKFIKILTVDTIYERRGLFP